MRSGSRPHSPAITNTLEEAQCIFTEAYYCQILVDDITIDCGSAHRVRVYGVVLIAPSGHCGIACYKILYLYIYTNEAHLQILQITEALFGIIVKKRPFFPENRVFFKIKIPGIAENNVVVFGTPKVFFFTNGDGLPSRVQSIETEWRVV